MTMNNTTTIIIKASKGSGSINWQAYSSNKITESAAKLLQQLRDYHPEGYGFYSFSCEPAGDGGYVAKWYCGDSCD